MKKIVIGVEGMSCKHCSAAVERAVLGVNGICGAKVSLKKECVIIAFKDEADIKSAVVSAIIAAGYKVK